MMKKQLKPNESTVIEQLHALQQQLSDAAGTIEFEVGEALSEAYFDAFTGKTQIADPVELLRHHQRIVRNQRLRVLPQKERDHVND